jgi:hypothetical protein
MAEAHWPAQLEALLPSVLDRVADAMSARSLETGSAGVESHLMQTVCEELALAVATRPQLDCLVEREKRVELGARWPGVGAVDVVVRLDEEAVLIELKWGASTLYNCLWDVAKLGSALASGVASGAYLFAGAPADVWETAPGSEFFETGDWDVEYLRTRYLAYWQFWEKDVKTRPYELPSRVRTRFVSSAAGIVVGGAWEIRCAAVEPSDWKWVPWQSTLL